MPDSNENLKEVALALWFDNFTPNVDVFEGDTAAQAGFLLDKLTRFNCLKSDRKAFLRNQLLPTLHERKSNYSQAFCSDKLAQQWGAAFELKSQFRELLPYQTRHYAQSH